MTGTDVMEQLDDLALMTQLNDFAKSNRSTITLDDRNNIKETVRKFMSMHPTCKLHNMHISNPDNMTDQEVDRVIDYIVAFRSKS
jgi:hypothetical protein